MSTADRALLTTLYRFYDAAGGLLYIGITSVGPMRWIAHGRNKAWWSQVATVKLMHFEDRATALAAEAAAILTEQPPYNTIHREGRHRRPGVHRRHGTGSVFRIQDGRWVASLSRNRKNVRRWVATEQKAWLALAELVAAADGSADRGAPVSVASPEGPK